jgi:hypothetical protein
VSIRFTLPSVGTMPGPDAVRARGDGATAHPGNDGRTPQPRPDFAVLVQHEATILAAAAPAGPRLAPATKRDRLELAPYTPPLPVPDGSPPTPPAPAKAGVVALLFVDPRVPPSAEAQAGHGAAATPAPGSLAAAPVPEIPVPSPSVKRSPACPALIPPPLPPPKAAAAKNPSPPTPGSGAVDGLAAASLGMLASNAPARSIEGAVQPSDAGLQPRPARPTQPDESVQAAPQPLPAPEPTTQSAPQPPPAVDETTPAALQEAPAADSTTQAAPPPSPTAGLTSQSAPRNAPIAAPTRDASLQGRPPGDAKQAPTQQAQPVEQVRDVASPKVQNASPPRVGTEAHTSPPSVGGPARAAQPSTETPRPERPVARPDGTTRKEPSRASLPTDIASKAAGAADDSSSPSANGMTTPVRRPDASSAGVPADVAAVAPAQDVNDLTLVSRMPAGQSPAGSSDQPEGSATTSAVNQAVMSQAARGEMDHPELGRVQVVAHSRDGQVDVLVTAQHAEAAAFLAPRAEAMAVDARHANVAVAHVSVESLDGSRENAPSTSQQAGAGGKQGNQAGREQHGEALPEEAADPPVPPGTKRVQIVL